LTALSRTFNLVSVMHNPLQLEDLPVDTTPAADCAYVQLYPGPAGQLLSDIICGPAEPTFHDCRRHMAPPDAAAAFADGLALALFAPEYSLVLVQELLGLLGDELEPRSAQLRALVEAYPLAGELH